jgi:aminoglycoside phosphotransferase (APT) family kinase protein
VSAPGVTHPSLVDRDRPDDDLLTRWARRFPTERETDALLRAKMLGRPGEPYRRPSLEQMTDSIRAFLESRRIGAFTISDCGWSSGGVSKIQVVFTLAWDDPARGRVSDRLVVRMDPDESLNVTSRAREFEVLQAVADVVPVPRVGWLDRSAEFFPRPALIYEFVSGVSKPRGTGVGQVTGLGTDFGERLRPVLAEQFMQHLGAIHRFVPDADRVPSMDVPAPATAQAAQWQLNRGRRVWEEDRAEDCLLLDVAAEWLADHLPVTETVGLVHGDYRSGNFLFDEETTRFTAWLDWERCHIGDRHRDLAWTTQPTFGHWDAARTRYYVCGLVPLDEFYDRYTEVSGLAVDQERLHFYRVLNNVQILAALVGTAYRVIRLRRSHQGMLLARLRGQAASIAADLQAMLREGPRG